MWYLEAEGILLLVGVKMLQHSAIDRKFSEVNLLKREGCEAAAHIRSHTAQSTTQGRVAAAGRVVFFLFGPSRRGRLSSLRTPERNEHTFICRKKGSQKKKKQLAGSHQSNSPRPTFTRPSPGAPGCPSCCMMWPQSVLLPEAMLPSITTCELYCSIFFFKGRLQCIFWW